ncbi:MAG: SusC/RagA family TonB-linked outer membrane protein [Cyclobacteriaceae bacterium]
MRTGLFYLFLLVFTMQLVRANSDGAKTLYPIIENETLAASTRGRVSDAEGNPMPGVNIIEKGTNNGTTTDAGGTYSLEVPDGDVILVFSFIGFVTQEIPVNGRSVIDVSLEEDIRNLSEVVVIGYGEQRKTEVTGAVANVTSEDFIQGNSRDAADLIQGKVAGLTVVSPTGDPTRRSQILLRGNSTLATSTQPLILIDGVPGDLNTLAQEDIASIDVLKDGSAAAIYGTRGTNGVILITSKKNTGKIKPTLSYNGYVSAEEWVRVPQMLTAADYRTRIAAGDAFTDLGHDNDWVSEISNEPSMTQYHNLSLRGGNTETSYMGSVNYRKSPGMIDNYDYSIFNTRFDLNHAMFNNKLRVNMNFIGNENKRGVDFNQLGQGLTDSFSSAVFNQALWRNPTAPLKNADGTWNEQTSISYYENPLGLLHETYGDYKSVSKRLTGSVTWEPIKNLSLKALASNITDNDARSQGHTKRHLSTVRDGLQGYAAVSSGQSTTKLLDLTADYSKQINLHGFRLMTGYNYQHSTWQSSSMRNWQFPAGNFSYPDNIGMGQRAGLGGPNLMSSAKYAYNLIGFFGRFNYNFNDKYLFMASLRHEASSKFIGTDKPWGTFPAVSAGWRIHEEEFIKATGLFDELKLRVGYGITGTAPDQFFLGVPLLGFQGSFLINGQWVPSLTPTRNPNPSLRWEEKRETNIGLDFAILNGRISGSIDYYNRTTDGLLYDFTVPTPPNAFRTTTANVGIMENKGLEVLLNFVPVQTAKLVWNSTANFSTNKNRLVSLSNDLYETTNPWFNAGSTGSPISTYTHRVEIGKEIGNFYGYKVIDVTEDGNWVYENKNGEPSETRVEEDKKYLGNGLPNYYAGWNNNIKYGNFNMNVTMRGAFDFQILNYQRMFYENPGRTIYNQLTTADDPIFGKTRLNNNAPIEYNSYYVEDGDYWKIDNVQLGYDFQVAQNKHIQRAHVYISTRNTFILTKYKGMDPEVNQLGLTPGNDDRNKYPSTRVYSLGVNLTIN